MTTRQPRRRRATAELDTIVIQGAREHNLQNIDLELPKKKLIVFTGVSGSGKSSLAFDTIFAEGQRRYVESLSAYARQFIGQMEKPRYDMIRGLSPTISIEQKSAGRNPRSTVGTITEIYDYLRVLYARIGRQYCLKCGRPVGRGSAEGMVDQIAELPDGAKIILLAPIVENRKGEHRDLLDRLRREGFGRVRIDGVVQGLEDVIKLPKHKKHTIDVVVDRLVVRRGKAFRQRLTDSVETALKAGQGRLIVHIPGHEDLKMNEARACCGMAYPALEPPLFSFNSPLGMCPNCNGIGSRLSMDPDKLVPDPGRTIRDGAVVPWQNCFTNGKGPTNSWSGRQLRAMHNQWGLPLDKPWRQLSNKMRKLVLFGSDGRELVVDWDSEKIQGSFKTAWEGLVPALMRRYRQTTSEKQKRYYAGFMSEKACETCRGRRLKPEVLNVRIDGRSIIELTEFTVSEALAFLKGLALGGNRKLIAAELVKEIMSRLGFLENVGLDYLTLARKGPTLSGGESQRIRLASQVGSELTGVLYILDEPTTGLHFQDIDMLLTVLQRLVTGGNTVLIIEHNLEVIKTVDWVIDLGPEGGHGGGRIVAQGPPEAIAAVDASHTGRYLSQLLAG